MNDNINIQPARRLSSVKEYYFSTKLKEIDALRRQGKDIISLGIGSPDMMPSAPTIQALCDDAKKADAHGYQSYVGIPELRQAFADFYKKNYDVALDPKSEIQPLIGSKEGVMHISLAFLNPGDGVLIPNPGYPTYAAVSNLVEAKVLNYDLLESNGWQPDFDALERMDLSGVKLMWVNYPNMPTGAPASLDLFQQLVDFGKRHNILIINDNPYSFILNRKHLSILQIPGAKDVCIELNSLSKSHNMPGWRMAMVAAQPQFIQWILKVKSNMDSGMFRPMQKAAAVALTQNTEEWHEEFNVNVYARRRALAEQIMTTLGCSFDPNQVGMFLWGKIPDTYADAGELADRVLYDADVFITPGFIFGTNGNRYVRVSLCAKDDKLAEALQRIKQLNK
ncbi:MAG: aminotransferase class I/II-fold pyridoxal phosphate-dependent enzyme [Paludibacteraceae bacterium]|nr:aminotransferase class I/II-fold pyridoxal phosphate-dependent enzyme [Paludibacteraceae bacterium]